MDFNAYQDATDKFAKYPRDAYIDYTSMDEDSSGPYMDSEPMAWLYPALALAEEAGEVSGKLAKYVRKQDFSGEAYDKLRVDITNELGDVLWQVAQVARQFGITLEFIATHNIAKLTDRENRNVIVGEGDSR